MGDEDSNKDHKVLLLITTFFCQEIIIRGEEFEPHALESSTYLIPHTYLIHQVNNNSNQ